MFDVIFIGDDWKGNERWKRTEQEMAALGVDVVYLPHTPETSSTMLKNFVGDCIEDGNEG